MKVAISRPSPALVVSIVALVVATGGTSYAAINLPARSVGTAQLKARSVGHAQLKARSVGSAELRARSVGTTQLQAKSVGTAQLRTKAVTTADLADGAVTSATVKDGTLQAKDFASGVLAGPAGPAGPAGAAGPQGSPGPQGVPGPAGTVRAYATVALGVLRPGARNITAVSRPSTGVYCLTLAGGISPVDSNAIVSPQWRNSTGVDLLAYPLYSPFDCPSGTLEVRTYQFAGLATPALSNGVSFDIMVP